MKKTILACFVLLLVLTTACHTTRNSRGVAPSAGAISNYSGQGKVITDSTGKSITPPPPPPVVVDDGKHPF